MKNIATIACIGMLIVSLSIQQAVSCGPPHTVAGPSNPVYINNLRIIAKRNIAKGEALLAQAQDMLAKAETEGKDTSSPEALMEEARTLLEKAKISLASPIAANNYALQAIKRLEQAIKALG